MEPTSNNASGKIITALIIGLLVGFAAGVFWQERRGATALETTAASESKEMGSKTSKEETASAIIGETKATAGEKASMHAASSSVSTKGLLVADQVAGGSVVVTNVDAKETLWVAVREEKAGHVGNILGAQKVQTGEGQTVTVDLLRPTVTGGTYRVVVYRDVGAPAFNYREDVLIEGVEATFTAK